MRKYIVGETLVSKRPDANGKPVYATVKRVDENARDGLTYYTESTDGTKKWWTPKGLSFEFRRTGEGGEISETNEAEPAEGSNESAKNDSEPADDGTTHTMPADDGEHDE